ncbi:hypothetical protein WJX84_004361 [Apatococcus fuscideae]|uniref:Kinetochore protein Spc24 n=1 Tax=Apatococcus fuscideae TaxID=2026836 RepID=A0AAW1SPQ2_9CHLO
MAEMTAAFDSRRNNAASKVAAVTSTLDERQSLLRLPDEEEHAKHVKDRQHKIEDVQQEIDVLQIEARSLSDQQKLLEGERRQLQEEEQRLSLLDAQIPKSRDELSLFAHISKIKWDADSQQGVAGIFSDPSRSKIETFSLPSDLSRFDQVNRLWKIID